MSAKANYHKIGVFIVLGLVTLIIAIVALSGGKWFKNVVYWESYFDESVQGLAVGSPIKYRGVQVGTVEAIGFVGDVYGAELGKEDLLRYGRYILVRGSVADLSPHLTEEEKKAQHGGRITAGLRVRLASQGVTGVVYLEADYLDAQQYPTLDVPWKPQAVYLPSAPSTVSVLGAALHTIARDLEKADIHTITRNLDSLVLEVTKLVKDTNEQALSSRTGRVLAEFQETARQTRRLVESPEIRAMVSDAAGTVQGARQLIADLSEASKQIKIASEQFPGVFARLERTVQRIDRLVSNKSQDIEDTVENLRVMSENLREITDNAKRYPAQVLLGEPPPRAGATKR
ncbi:MAG: MlaD family protein [Nitrospira sp.]|nr:MlaD family protein [Nitrospira sp.]HMV57089.1 MlaD family protein [Nitrospira sp.]HNA49053.1 MlaD family protein [Nitrospira sp.]HNE33514.1 MlaD family protein [Nitrospira sp.]HNJ21152.1 MlaD family protein [Nitrospira sp.]